MAQVPSTNYEDFSQADSLKIQNTRTNFKTSCYFSIDKTLGTMCFLLLFSEEVSAFVVTRNIVNPKAQCNNSPFLSNRLDGDRNISANFQVKYFQAQ